MATEHISSSREFENIKRNSGNVLVVVDFHASWCGPCLAIAPFYEQLASRYGRRARFLKVDVDEAQDIASQCGVTAMPTFHFYVRGSKVAELQGADRAGLEANCERFAPSSAQISFGGVGQTLGTTADAPPKVNWDAKPAGAATGGGSDADAAKARREAMAKAAAARVAAAPKKEEVKKEAEEPKKAEETEAAKETEEPVAAADEAAVTESAAPMETDEQPDKMNDPRLKVDASLLRQLEEMGFPKIRAQKGLIFTGNKSLEPAMEWCFEHSDDADIDEPLSLVAADGAAKPVLSEEERKARAADALLKARARRQGIDKKEAAEREKARIRSGKEIANTRRTLEENERRRMVELKRKEKRDALAEKNRVKMLLEEDKARRRELFRGTKPAPEPVAAPKKEAGPPPAAVAGKIQLRLQDGSRLEESFEPEQVLGDVKAFVVEKRPELAGKTIGFSQMYPRRKFAEEDFGKSLESLGLLPRGALNVSF